jgi:hypothetical protein
MPVRRRSESEPPPRRRLTAATPEDREAQMVGLAYDLAEKRIRNGTASAQEVTHFLKLGSTRERLEQARLEGELELQKAKVEAMGSTKKLEALYKEAMDAFLGYQGKGNRSEDPDDV